MKKEEMISLDQALIIALRLHDRKDCNLLQAVKTGFQLRKQINFLSEHGIGKSDFERLISNSRDVTDCWDD